jgi:hypothetical protein
LKTAVGVGRWTEERRQAAALQKKERAAGFGLQMGRLRKSTGKEKDHKTAENGDYGPG